MKRVKNISDETQMFTGVPPIPAGEEIDVDDATAELLLRSPFIKPVGGSLKAVQKGKTFKGVDPE